MGFLKKIDFFPAVVTFNTNKNQKHHTNIGGIFGILLIIIFISLFIIFGLDCFNRTNPKIVQQTQSSSKIQEFKLNPGDFNMSFSFFYKIPTGLEKIPTQYFNIDFGIGNQSVSFDPSYFNTSFSSDNYSVIYNIKNQITVFDYLTSSGNFSYIPFQINLCSPKIYSACSLETIKSVEKNYEIFLSLTIFTYGLDISNVENPLIKVKKSFFLKLNTYVSKNMFFTFKKVEAKNDLGWLFTAPNFLNGFDIESFLNDFNEINTKVDYGVNVFRGALIFGRNLDYYSISYTKIQDVFAQVGGIINIFNVLFKILVDFYSQNEIDNYLVNSLVNDNLKEKSKRSLRKLDTIKYQNEILELPNDVKDVEPQEITELTLFEKIKSNLCRTRIKKKQLEIFIKFRECLEKTNELLDINEYFELRKKVNFLQVQLEDLVLKNAKKKEIILNSPKNKPSPKDEQVN